MSLAASTTGFAGGEEVYRRELLRWGTCLLLVLGLHAGLAVFLISYRIAPGPIAPATAIVMLELAPLPAAPPEPERELPSPSPLPLEPQIEPEPPPPPQVTLPPEPATPPLPALVLPQPAKKGKPVAKSKPIEHRPPPPPEPAPTLRPSVASPQSLVPAAPGPPAPAPTAAASAAARVTWQGQVMGWLARYKRYPRAAQPAGQQGTAQLSFTIDRSGRVISSQLSRSSGVPILDEEARELIQRAQPIPPPPPEVQGGQIVLQVPIEFSIRR